MTAASVVCSDERTGGIETLPIDIDRWQALAMAVLAAEGTSGELTVTFVDEVDIADLNAEHMGKDGPTDVLSFPLDDDTDGLDGIPALLGDIVVCPSVAERQFAEHAGTLDDELALLVVHGILHVLGHDHAEPEDAARMRRRELEHLTALHWHGPAPAGFRQTHD